jgi:hypothetical protein
MVVVLGFITLTKGPKIRQVTFDLPPESTNLSLGTNITLKFDRAITNDDYGQLISFEPAIEFEAQTFSQEIRIITEQNFDSQQQYRLIVQPGIKDSTGREITDVFEYIFETPAPSFAFLERNVEASTEPELAKTDSIFIKTPDGQQTEIYQADRIRSFVINQQYMAVVEYSDDSDSLFVVDRNTDEKNHIDMPMSGAITKIVAAPRSNIALLIIEPDFSKVTTENYQTFAKRLYSLDMSAGSMKLLTDDQDQGIQATDVFISPDGQIALFKQSQNNDFYITSTFDDFEPVLLGANDASYGFNQFGSQVFFTNNGIVSAYNLSGGGVVKASDGLEPFSQVNATTRLVYGASQSFKSPSEPTISFSRADAIDDEFKEVWQFSQSQVLSQFNISYDSNIIAAEVNHAQCQFLNIGFTRECSEALTKIYDTRTNQQMDEIMGSNLIWLP